MPIHSRFRPQTREICWYMWNLLIILSVVLNRRVISYSSKLLLVQNTTKKTNKKTKQKWRHGVLKESLFTRGMNMDSFLWKLCAPDREASAAPGFSGTPASWATPGMRDQMLSGSFSTANGSFYPVCCAHLASPPPPRHMEDLWRGTWSVKEIIYRKEKCKVWAQLLYLLNLPAEESVLPTCLLTCAARVLAHRSSHSSRGSYIMWWSGNGYGCGWITTSHLEERFIWTTSELLSRTFCSGHNHSYSGFTPFCFTCPICSLLGTC